jgi:hypothetical protein
MKLNDFGLLVTSAVNSTNPNAKKEILINSEIHKNEFIKNKEKENKKKEYYINTYENIREQYRILYEDYIINRQILYNKWIETKSLADLHNLISHKIPDIETIDDIYTTDIKRSNLKLK